VALIATINLTVFRYGVLLPFLKGNMRFINECVAVTGLQDVRGVGLWQGIEE
jgi:hypothetical protein